MNGYILRQRSIGRLLRTKWWYRLLLVVVWAAYLIGSIASLVPVIEDAYFEPGFYPSQSNFTRVHAFTRVPAEVQQVNCDSAGQASIDSEGRGRLSSSILGDYNASQRFVDLGKYEEAAQALCARNISSIRYKVLGSSYIDWMDIFLVFGVWVVVAAMVILLRLIFVYVLYGSSNVAVEKLGGQKSFVVRHGLSEKLDDVRPRNREQKMIVCPRCQSTKIAPYIKAWLGILLILFFFPLGLFYVLLTPRYRCQDCKKLFPRMFEGTIIGKVGTAFLVLVILLLLYGLTSFLIVMLK